MKHCSIIRRKRSPFYYLAYWDPAEMRRVQRATDVRVDDPRGRIKVLELARARSQEAMAHRGTATQEMWDAWVVQYLRSRYDNAGTLTRYLNGWGPVRAWLEEARILCPRQIEYRHAREYVEWRKGMRRHSGKAIAHNTALTDLKVINVVMWEAVRRGFCPGNPIAKPGIRKRPARPKPEITAREEALIRRALVSEPEWMRICFEIAIHQGCRLTETQVLRGDVDTDRGVITFRAKGAKVFATALHPKVREIALRCTGERLVVLPRMAAKEWHFFFKRIGLPHLSFHCTRVTVITRLARAGVTQQQAMAYVGHASETVHQIYQRLQPPDLSAAVSAV